MGKWKKVRKMVLLGSLGLHELSNFKVGFVNLLYEPIITKTEEVTGVKRMLRFFMVKMREHVFQKIS